MKWLVSIMIMISSLWGVTMNTPESVTKHSMRLTWTVYTGSDFDHYNLYRYITPGEDTLIAVISQDSVNYFLDGELHAGSKYFYYVCVVDTSDSTIETSNTVYERTLPNEYPFRDSIESNDLNFAEWGGSEWGVVSDFYHSPSYSYTDSPGSQYNVPSDNSLYLEVNLENSQMPVLSFWERHIVDNMRNGTHCLVEISTNFDSDSPTWEVLYSVQGTSDWNRVFIDLSGYRDNVVMIRFRLKTNNSSEPGDGWWIDDITIDETESDTIHLTFFDNVEDSSVRSKWISSSWAPINNGINGSLAWNVTRYREIGPVSDISLTLGNVLDLSNSVHPQIQFYVKKSLYCSLYLETSSNGGATWDSIIDLNYNHQYQNFTRFQIDLSSYSGLTPRIRFRLHGYGDTWVTLDNILIKEAPQDVSLEPAADITQNSAKLTWHGYNGTNFKFYELRRDTTSVTWNSPVVAVFSSPDDTVYCDSSLNAHTEYYYRVYVVDTTDMRSVGSNEISFLTNWISQFASYPYNEGFEDGIPSNFVADSGWGLVAGFSHSGTYSINESPDGNYPAGMDRSIYFGIDLSQALRPVLSFWQFTDFGNDLDQGWVEVSYNGEDWTRLYVVNGSHPWEKVQIDLSPFRTHQQVFIRFRFVSDDNELTGNGWFIDDISVNESSVSQLPFPFYDDVENPDNNWWIPSRWVRTPLVGVDGSYAWKCMVDDDNSDNRDNFSLVLGNSIDLRNSFSPAVSFYINGYANYTYLYVSVDSGPWVSIWQGEHYVHSYSHVTVSLSQFQGHFIRLKFVEMNLWGGHGYSICLDNIRVFNTYNGLNVVDTAKLISPDTIFLSPGLTSPPVFAMVYKDGVTDSTGQGHGIIAQVGYGPAHSMPDDSLWTWVNATYCGDSGIYDVYRGIFTADGLGTFNFAFRFSSDSGTYWIYSDLNGNDLGSAGFNGYEPSNSGYLLISEPPELAYNPDSVIVNIPQGGFKNYHVTVSNSGNGPLSLELFESIDGTTACDVPFLTISPTTMIVQPGDTTLFTVSLNGDTTIGSYSVGIMLESNDPDEREIFLPVIMNIDSSADAFLGGALVANDGSPIGRIGTVEIYSDTTFITEVETDGMGQFSISGLQPGQTYSLRCFAHGFYPTWYDNVTIPAQNLNITLNPVPTPQFTNEKVDFYGDTVKLNSNPVKEGDVITVFDPDGVLCGVYYVQTPGQYGILHVYGDDPTTDVDEGAELGDTLTFLVDEYPVTYSGSHVWTGNNALIKLNLTASQVDSVFLRSGWNLISFTIMPQDTEISSILSSLNDNLVVVTGFDQSWGGARTYDPSLPGFSDLTSLDPFHGYWIKLNHEDTLIISGCRVHSSSQIVLNSGWNLVGYLPEPAESVGIALSSIMDNIYVVDGFDSVAMTYRPGSSYNDLFVMKNGLGYWIKTYVSDTLDYSEGFVRNNGSKILSQKYTGDDNSKAGPTPYWSDYYGNAFLNGYPVEIGDTITAFDPDGVLCGTFVVRTHGQYGFMHVYGDDPSTVRVDEGAEPGDSIRFYVNGNYVATATGDYSWRGGRSLIEFNLGTMKVNERGNDQFELKLLPISPNPVHGRFFVNFTVPMREYVEISLFDVTGRKVEEVVSRNFNPGQHRIKVEAHNLKTGVYFIQLKARDFTSTVKFVVE